MSCPTTCTRSHCGPGYSALGQGTGLSVNFTSSKHDSQRIVLESATWIIAQKLNLLRTNQDESTFASLSLGKLSSAHLPFLQGPVEGMLEVNFEIGRKRCHFQPSGTRRNPEVTALVSSHLLQYSIYLGRSRWRLAGITSLSPSFAAGILYLQTIFCCISARCVCNNFTLGNLMMGHTSPPHATEATTWGLPTAHVLYRQTIRYLVLTVFKFPCIQAGIKERRGGGVGVLDPWNVDFLTSPLSIQTPF
jgi:hypothetical protein